AVLFDLWETLINDKPERAQPRRIWRGSAVQDVLKRHNTDAAIEAIQAALDASSMALSRMHDDGKDLDTDGRAQLFVAQLEMHAGIRPPEVSIRDLEDVITAMPLDIAPLLAPFAVETTSAIKQR